MTAKKRHLLLALLAFTVFNGGCKLENRWKKWTGNMDKPEYVITINKIVKYPQAKDIEQQIATFSGRTVWINIQSYIHSNAIKEIELVPRNGSQNFFDLKLFMNRKGRMRWMQLSAGFKNEPLAFVIDGTFYRSFIPKPMVGDYDADDNSTYVIIEGPFDKGTAEALKEWAPKNFLYFNDDENAEF